MKFFSSTGAVLLPLATVVGAIELKVDDESSIKNAAQQYANGLMSYYKYGATQVPKEQVGYFPKPHYWWEAGAVWGGLIEYTKFIGDDSYVKTVQEALTANYGTDNDIILPYLKDQQGNDDQAFWCLATMSALEYGFPEPDQAPASYLQVTENCFNNIVSRWDTTTCGGGLKWQIYPENAYGYNYKNSISNGATFALAARLARYTGNQTYSDWAGKIYDWTRSVKLIGDKFEVFDGTDDKTNCASVSDKTEWTYNNAMFLHGCAFMSDVTNGNSTWTDRVNGFLDRAATFFNNPDSVPDVMFEVCENSQKACNLDQQSFKAYLARWMAKTAILVPSTKEKVTTYLTASAEAAAKACSGGDDKKSCGSRWYTGQFDSLTGIGQQLSALEVTQNLLMLKQGTTPNKGGDSKPSPSASSTPVASSTPAASSALASSAAATKASSSADATPTPSVAESSAAPAASGSNPSPSDAQSPAPSSTSGATQPAGQFGELKPNSTAGVCTCTPKSTTTVYVQPTPPPASVPASAPAVPPTSAPVVPPAVPTTTIPTAPPANTTGPALFPGAASNVKMAGSTLFIAAGLAVMAALL